MAINELVKILKQVHEPDEFRLSPHDLNHGLYYIWKLDGVTRKDLNSELRYLRQEHARFDIFINGQYILEKDYIVEASGSKLLVKFKKSNFPYVLESDDNIKIEGDLDLL